jgi:hypothetical protein
MAVSQADLATRVEALVYGIDRGGSSQPEFRGDAQEGLDASSSRRQHIEEQLAKAHY